MELEKLIRTAFNIGKTWDCVLLFDDADVALEERSLNDLGRNALVATFMLLVDRFDRYPHPHNQPCGGFCRSIPVQSKSSRSFQTP